MGGNLVRVYLSFFFFFYQEDGVACGEGSDVGAGDDAAALLLEEVADLVDGVEAGLPEGQVRWRELLAIGAVEQDRPLAALHKEDEDCTVKLQSPAAPPLVGEGDR